MSCSFLDERELSKIKLICLIWFISHCSNHFTMLECSCGSRVLHWGGGTALLAGWGRQPLIRELVGENICKNETFGSRWGGGRCRRRPPLDPPMECNDIFKIFLSELITFLRKKNVQCSQIKDFLDCPN